MEKYFEKAFIEIIRLDSNDIIVTSFGFDDIDGSPNDVGDGDSYWD